MEWCVKLQFFYLYNSIFVLSHSLSTFFYALNCLHPPHSYFPLVSLSQNLSHPPFYLWNQLSVSFLHPPLFCLKLIHYMVLTVLAMLLVECAGAHHEHLGRWTLDYRCLDSCDKWGVISDNNHGHTMGTDCGWIFWCWANRELTVHSGYQCWTGDRNWRGHYGCFHTCNCCGRCMINTDHSNHIEGEITLKNDLYSMNVRWHNSATHPCICRCHMVIRAWIHADQCWCGQAQ